MQSTSTRWSINWLDVWKAVRTALVVGVAAIVMYFISNVEPNLVAKIPTSYSFLLPFATLITEIVRRWASSYTPAA